MPYISGVRVYDLIKEFSEGIGDQGPYASRSWFVPDWESRYTVANGLLALSTVTGGTRGTVSFSRPASYPDSQNLLARNVSIRGVGVPSVGANQIRWTSAIVSCQFGIPTYSIESPQNTDNEIDPGTPLKYCTQSLSFGSQVVTIPKHKLKIAGGTKFLEQSHGIPVRLVAMKLQFHFVPFLIPLYVRESLGRVNDAAFLGCAPGTVLFDGLETQRELQSDGSVSQETTFSLVYRPAAPWDQIIDPQDGTWTQVTWGAGGSILSDFDMGTLIPNGYRV